MHKVYATNLCLSVHDEKQKVECFKIFPLYIFEITVLMLPALGRAT